jgi:hypothetical protein
MMIIIGKGHDVELIGFVWIIRLRNIKIYSECKNSNKIRVGVYIWMGKSLICNGVRIIIMDYTIID